MKRLTHRHRVDTLPQAHDEQHNTAQSLSIQTQF